MHPPAVRAKRARAAKVAGTVATGRIVAIVNGVGVADADAVVIVAVRVVVQAQAPTPAAKAMAARLKD